MTDIMTDEDKVRSALRRLNPEFYGLDASWTALDNIIDEGKALRGLLARIEFELSHPMMDGSNVVRARELAAWRHAALADQPPEGLAEVWRRGPGPRVADQTADAAIGWDHSDGQTNEEEA